MRKRNMRGYVAALALTVGLCMTQGLSVQAATDVQGDSGSDQEYEAADPSKGVTYVKNDAGSTMGIDLNGNSVIIRKSNKSTSQSTYINIYNDKNRNGELDEGESAFELDGSADILYPGMPVYGLYEQKSDRPLAITLDGVELGSVYGVYGGCIETGSDSSALIVRALNEADLKVLTAAEKSEVKGDVKLQFVDTSVSSGPLYIGKTAQISGNVSLSLNGGSYYMINALASGSTVQKNVDVKLRNVSFTGTDTSGIVLSGSTVNGDVNFDADGINVSSQSEFHVLNSGSANDLTVSLKNYIGKEWTFYGTNNSAVKGDLDLKILGGSGTFANIYGTYSSGIYGHASIQIEGCICSGAIMGSSSECSFISRGSAEDGYTVDVAIKNCKVNGIVYGLNGVKQIYSLKLTMQDIDGGSASIYGYQSGSANVTGPADISLDNCKGYSIYGYSGYTSENYKTSAAQKISVTNCTASWSIYIVYSGYFGDDCIINSSKNIWSTYTGFYYAKADKNVMFTSAHENDSTILDENGQPVIDSNSSAGSNTYYMLQGATINGDVTVDVTGIRCKAMQPLSSSTIYGNSDFTIRDSEVFGSSNDTVQFASYATSTDEHHVNVQIENTDFSAMSSLRFSNTLADNTKLTMTVKDDCKLPSTCYVIPNTNETGSAIITIGNDIYYGGTVVLNEDVSADNVYFGNYANYSTALAIIQVSENVTVTAKENLYITSSTKLLNKGTIKANAIKSLTSSNPKIYLNGGQIDTEENAAEIYYPIKLAYNKNAGVVSTGSGETISLDPGVYYGKNEQNISVYISTSTGYQMKSAIVKKDSETTGSELAVSGYNYSFDMPDESVTIVVTFEGLPITIKKAAADPCAVINKEYTSEAPLYDLTRLVIINDAKEGTVQYKEDTTYDLPQGLKIEDGKIIGTPTVLYENGKQTDIHVTGKNGTEAVLKLNVIVSTKQQVQESTSERLTIDEEKKEINLNGTSAVIQEMKLADSATVTGIYADDNQDGKPDGKSAMYSADLSDYVIKGVDRQNSDRSVRITMLSGSVGTIYGAYNSQMSYTDSDAVVVDVQGGTVNNVYGLGSGASLDGCVAVKTGKNATVGTAAIKDASYAFFAGSLLDKTGAITLDKKYVVNELLSGDSLVVKEFATIIANARVELTGTFTLERGTECTINKGVKADKFTTNGNLSKIWFHDNCEFGSFEPNYCWVTIEEDAKLTADDIKAQNTSGKILHKGVVSGKTFSSTAKWLVIGSFAEDTDISDWSKLYFKVTATSNMEGITGYSSAEDFGWSDGEDGDGLDYYLPGNTTQNITYVDVPGYTAVLSVNGGEAVEGDANGRCALTFPQEKSEIYVEYIAKQITCTKQYSDPVVVKDTEYTAEDPAYDLNQLKLENDTSLRYGSAKKYRIKAGSKLPDGLILQDGKVVGTPADTAETTETVFRITGRNGSEAECKVVFTVEEAGYKVTDLTKELDVKEYSDIDLKGHSVVIMSDASDGSGKKVSIYPDDDHDGVADSGRALKIGGKTSYDLSSRSIYGYKDNTPYEGDISIYMYGGSIGGLFGAGTSSKGTAQAKVDGTVSLYVKGGTISYRTAGAYNADVKKVELYATGGSFYRYVYGLQEASADDLVFHFTDKAHMAQTPFGETYSMYFAKSGTVRKNADIRIGASGSQVAFADYKNSMISNKSNSYGFYESTIQGNATFDVVGNWSLGSKSKSWFLNDSTVKGDVDITLDTTSFGISNSTGTDLGGSVLVYKGSVGNITITDKTGCSNYVVAAQCTVNNIVGKRTVTGTSRGIVTYLYQDSNYTLNGGLYAEDYQDVYVGGTYTINKDVATRDLHVLNKSDITIADGTTVTYTGDAELNGSITNHGSFYCKGDTTVSGTFTNTGDVTLLTATTLTMDTTARFINKADASLCFGKLKNEGTIINEGILDQTVNAASIGGGDILTSTKPDMYKTYSNIYYKAELEYPEFCFAESTDAPVSLAASTESNMKTTGIEGDNSVYIRGGAAVSVTVTGTPIDDLTVDAIKYGSSDSSMTKSDDASWTANMPYEPTIFTVNMASDTATAIVLDKEEDSVDTAVVGITTTADHPLYDLTALKISNDIDNATAKVTYSLAKGSYLPSGLELKNGKIYGTPKQATGSSQIVTVKVCGKNQTVAAFKLTFTKVAKGTPVMDTPNACVGIAGKTLESVTLPTAKKGKYQWVDKTTVIEKAGTAEYDAYFIPTDITNYDWSKANIAEDAYEVLANGSVRIKVKLTVKSEKQIPTYTVPTDLKGIYGQTLADVTIPETEDGTFAWVDDSISLGEVGSRSFKAVYTPKNGDIYENAEDITITVMVEPAKPGFKPELDAITVKQGTVLGDVELPDVEGGYYYWYTAKTTVINEAGDYKVCYKPSDITNYDWTETAGWSNAHKGIILSVRILVGEEHAHTFVWKSDATKHWKECTCGDKTEAEEHTFNAGEITKAPTTTATGIKTYECTVCGYQKQEILPKKEETPDPDKPNPVDPTPDNPNPVDPTPDNPNPVDPNPGTPEVTDISKAVVSGIVNKAYTGKAQVQSKLTVSLGGKVLTAGKDYVVAYKNNKNAGKATMTIKGQNGYTGTLSKTFNIKISKGKTYVVKSVKYKVTKAATNGKGTVMVTGSSYKKTNKKFKTLKLGKTVKIGGISYKITAVNKNAFKGYKYLKSVTIGDNITTIGNSAFEGCKALTTVKLGKGVTKLGSKVFYKDAKLKNITITSKKLKTVGKNVFNGIHKKPVVKLPKSKYTKYVKLLKKAKMPSKVTYKKIK
uniref:leucine-rich repeat protein n=1 Tax=Coprococcus sp. TaxID=2049024 RepID=UPI003FEE5294